MAPAVVKVLYSNVGPRRLCCLAVLRRKLVKWNLKISTRSETNIAPKNDGL